MSPEQLAEAQQYHRQGLICDLIDRVIDVVYLSVAAFLLAQPIESWLAGQGWLSSRWLLLAVFFVVLTALHIAVSSPLSYYAGHVLEHRYNLSRQTSGRWLWRYAKRQLLALAFGLVMIEGLFAVIWFTGWWWWLVAAACFFVVSVVVGQLVPVLIVPLFYKMKRVDDEKLGERLSELAQGTGLTVEGTYEIALSEETAKANAMLAGLGRTRRVILADTLLEKFSADEIDVVFTHELGHHVHRHIWWMLLTGAVYGLVGLWLCDRVLAWAMAGADGNVAYAELSVAALPLLMLCFTLFGQLLEPISNALSRLFERQADRYALDRTQNPVAFRTAFGQLARQNKADPDPPGWEVFLFHDHPPISERIAMADAWSAI